MMKGRTLGINKVIKMGLKKFQNPGGGLGQRFRTKDL